jgi:4-hydroxy-3-methylbut-2-enyl diphosphate reductase
LGSSKEKERKVEIGRVVVKVIRAEVLGFCMGVRRAVELASAEARKAGANGGRVYTLGPLIHNPKVLSCLESLGVRILDEIPQNLEGCSVIIRAHGISPAAEKELVSRGCRVIDATCPKVKACQMKTEELSSAGCCLFLAGEAGHAEIKGILGYAQAAGTPFCAVVGSAAEARKAAAGLYETNKDAKTAVLGQTTICEEEYLAIGEAVKKYFPDVEIVKTICAATADRQQALRGLLDQADAVIIAGGMESANTRRLLAIAKDSGKPCALVEDPSVIPAFFYFYKTVGLCAGASAPDSLIDEIELELNR